MTLRFLIGRHRWGVGLCLALVLVENLAWILEPSLFGRVIDAMIHHRTRHIHMVVAAPLLLWAGAFLANSAAGAVRRALEARVYLGMFADAAREIAARGRELGQGASRTAARAHLSKEFVTFLQDRVPDGIEEVVAVGGALVGLAVYDRRIAAVCLVVTVPLALIQRLYSRRVAARQAELHDSLEETYEVFAAGDAGKVHAYFSALAIPQRVIARWGALSFGALRLVLLVIFVAVLYIAIDLDHFTTGKIYSIVAYLWTFVSSSEYLPRLLESWTSLRDISRRLGAEIW